MPAMWWQALGVAAVAGDGVHDSYGAVLSRLLRTPLLSTGPHASQAAASQPEFASWPLLAALSRARRGTWASSGISWGFRGSPGPSTIQIL